MGHNQHTTYITSPCFRVALLGTGNPALFGGSVLRVCFSMCKHLFDISIPT